MSFYLKNVLQMLAGLLLVVIIVVLIVFVPVFTGNKPLVDGARLPGGATQIVDGYVSIILLPAGGDDLALIDCGDDPAGAALLKAVGNKKVSAIFLTHGHPDHTAGCHLFPEAKVYGFAADAKIAAAEASARGWLPKLFPLAPDKAIKMTDMLQDGQEVKVGELTVKAYAVPGHTAGSAAYLSSGVLYLGDNATGRADGKSVKPAPPPFSDDPAENVASVAKLRARLVADKTPVTLLAFAHSGSIEGLDALATAK